MVFDQAIERAALPPVVVGVCGRETLIDRSHALLQDHQAVTVFVRQGLQQHRVDHAEDCRIRADPQAQREDGRKGEPRALAHHAQRESGILPKHRQVLARSRAENSHNRLPP